MTLNELAKAAGKSTPFVIHLLNRVHVPRAREYSPGVAVLLNKLIGLSLCSISQKDVELLLTREKKLLELLKVDSLSGSLTWFEDLCVMDSGPTRLLLSGYDLGHPVSANGVQTGLDFAQREAELFSSREMGADALHALKRYTETLHSILVQMQAETPILTAALKWTKQVCGNPPG